MAEKRFHAADIARIDWHWADAHKNDHEVISVAAQLHTAKQLDRVVLLLQALNNKLDSLGNDGIHHLIRIAAKEHRKREQLRKVKAANKRRATMAKKRAAQVAA